MAPGLWGAVLANRRPYRFYKWYVNYLWVFGDKLWKSFQCTFLFLLEESLIKSPALEQIYLFLEIFCNENGIAGNNVMEMLENLSIFFGRNNYSSYRDATKLAQNCFITLFPPMPRKWHRKIKRIEKCMCSPQTSKSNCHFFGMGGNNVINQFCASFVAWWVTTFKMGAGWIGLISQWMRAYVDVKEDFWKRMKIQKNILEF